MFEKIKHKFTKNNSFVLFFLIFLSIPIIIGVSLGTGRAWYDVISIISIFYIGIPILIIIFTINNNGMIKKIISNFKFKEVKKIKREKISSSEEVKMKILGLDSDASEKKKSWNKSNILFISISLIIFGVLILLCTIPSLIIFTLK